MRFRFRRPPAATSAKAALKMCFSCCINGKLELIPQKLDGTHIGLLVTDYLLRVLHATFLLDKVRRWFGKWPDLEPFLKEFRPECGLLSSVCHVSKIRGKVFVDEHFLVRCLPQNPHGDTSGVGNRGETGTRGVKNRRKTVTRGSSQERDGNKRSKSGKRQQ